MATYEIIYDEIQDAYNWYNAINLFHQINKLKDEEYAAKYARAKYYYSKQGERVYTIPGLLPQ